MDIISRSTHSLKNLHLLKKEEEKNLYRIKLQVRADMQSTSIKLENCRKLNLCAVISFIKSSILSLGIKNLSIAMLIRNGKRNGDFFSIKLISSVEHFVHILTTSERVYKAEMMKT